MRMAVEFRRDRNRPIFVRTVDEQGKSHDPSEFDQLQLLEAYEEYRFEKS